MRRYAVPLFALLLTVSLPAVAAEQCEVSSAEPQIAVGEHTYCNIYARQADYAAKSAAYTEQLDARRAAYLAPMLAAEQGAAGGGFPVSAEFAATGDPLADHEAAVDAAVDSGLTLSPEAEGPAANDVIPVPAPAQN